VSAAVRRFRIDLGADEDFQQYLSIHTRFPNTQARAAPLFLGAAPSLALTHIEKG
jgi:hypothetical protein